MRVEVLKWRLWSLTVNRLRQTSARVTSFDVAGNADHRQCVDAAQTKHQCEETIHLEETGQVTGVYRL